MRRQEEIREGVQKCIDTYAELGARTLSGMIVDYLHSKGVVIKAERGHDSDCAVHNEPAYPNEPCDCIELPVGCVAVEPLTEPSIIGQTANYDFNMTPE